MEANVLAASLAIAASALWVAEVSTVWPIARIPRATTPTQKNRFNTTVGAEKLLVLEGTVGLSAHQ